MEHRRDIDGLRGIAIVLVLFYHFKVPGFAGGFVGVDVFFVISGFLITGLVQGALTAGNFSLRYFYARRIRRLLPNLLTACAVATVFAGLVLPPLELRAFGRDLAAALFFASNIITATRGGGYFAPHSVLFPLRMLWSLGIEEQFYLFWPLTLVFLSKKRWPVLWVTVTLIGSSLALSAWQVTAMPLSAFFLLPARAWELALGALLAQKVGGGKGGATLLSRRKWLAEAVALVGLSSIFAAAVMLADASPFPGFLALLPTVGAAAFIVAVPHTVYLQRLVNTRVLVGTGLRSYSLYLWHWPVLSFTQWLCGEDEPLGVWMRVSAGLLAYVLAALAYHLVEIPARRPSVSTRQLCLWLVPATVLTAGIGTLIFVFKGVPERFTSGQLAALYPGDQVAESCFLRPPGAAFSQLDRLHCTVGTAPGSRLLIWGDSHAHALFAGLGARVGAAGITATEYTRPGCLPLVNNQGGEAVCRTNNDELAQELPQHKEFSAVVIAGRWFNYRHLRGEGVNEFKDDLRATVKFLLANGRKVSLFADVPEFPFRVPLCSEDMLLPGLTYRLQYGRACQVPRRNVAGSFAVTNRAVKEIALEFPNICFADLSEQVCDGDMCTPKKNGVSLYYDNHHLSAAGARLLATSLAIERCLPDHGAANSH